MRAGGQRAKAADHELAVAKIFTAAYYPHDDGEFRRTPLSGGWDKRIAPADLTAFKYTGRPEEAVAIDKSFPFVIECKNWMKKNVNFLFAGLYTGESVIYDWVAQATADAGLVGQIPLVVFKIWKDNCVILYQKDFFQIKLLFGEFPKKHYLVERLEREKSIRLFFCRLDDFIEWIDWEVYKLSSISIRIKSLIPKEER